MESTKPNSFSIESSRSDASYLLSKELMNIILDKHQCRQELIILCIGTDRSTGDCLGPLVGDKLSRFRLNKRIAIHGTLQNPVHAKNLSEITRMINNEYENPTILAIDASLGKNENVGKINLYNGPVFPGSGVNKKLDPVGDISITGIVNISGFMEYMVLQNTRLSLVMSMADIISNAIYYTANKMYPTRSIVN